MIDSKQTKCLYKFIQDMKDREKEHFSQGCQKQMFELVLALAEVIYENKEEK